MSKATRSDRTRLIARDGHSLHFGLSAPPTASQASVPGVAIETQLCSNDANVGGRTAAPTYSTARRMSFGATWPVPRSHHGRRLCVALKLQGTGSRGETFEELATTDNVSMSGFLCRCTAELSMNAVLDVYLASHRDEYVGKARIVHSSSKGELLWHYGCRFIEKTGPWVLQ
jgi:hypothetical protein